MNGGYLTDYFEEQRAFVSRVTYFVSFQIQEDQIGKVGSGEALLAAVAGKQNLMPHFPQAADDRDATGDMTKPPV